ncbi:MAG: hypothetical protein OXR68_07205 [Alphaproteobacteria bacterium]|nr:hypothetical protein [Alphaproteobacteria bacterium]MDD9920390.1 hypothetical protein [Alphaproteobacteria bacterium]
MSNIDTAFWLVVLCLFSTLSAVLYYRKKHGQKGFAIANRELEWWEISLSGSASLRDVAYWVFFWLPISYTSNYALMCGYISWAFGLIILSFSAPKIRKKAQQKNYVSLGEMAFDLMGGHKLAASVLLTTTWCVNICFVGAQVYAISHIAAVIAPISPFWATFITIAIVGVYMVAGGFRSVILTDVIQFAFIVLMLTFPIAMHIAPEKLMDWASLFKLGLWETLGMCLIAFWVSFTNADIWIRMFAAKNDNAAVWGVRGSAILTPLLSVGLVFTGMYAATAGIGFPLEVESPYKILESMLVVANNPIMNLLPAALIAMGMSTIDTNLYVGNAIMLRDLLSIKDEKTYIKYSQVIMPITLGIVLLLALSFTDLDAVMKSILGVVGLMAPIYYVFAVGCYKSSKVLDVIVATCMVGGLILFFYLGTPKSFFEAALPATITMAIAFVCLTVYQFTYRTR